MSVHNAKLGDIYRDGCGALWRVYGRCDEPTVYVERIGNLEDLQREQRHRQSGGVSGLMWNDFTKVGGDT